MVTFADKLFAEIQRSPSLSDRELTDILCGADKHPSQVNQEARLLESAKRIVRRHRVDRKIGNYPEGVSADITTPIRPHVERTPERLSEDELKEFLDAWLHSQGWSTRIAWAKARGIDIEASRGGKRWLIEVKGLGSRDAMRVNYFLGILGETLQRMADEEAKYSIALPDVPQFRGLWSRLPELAKSRTTITALFVSPEGVVRES